MTSYRYRAARPDGRVIAGLIDAETGEGASIALQRDGVFPLRIEAAGPREIRRSAASRRELAIAFQSLAALVAGGVPLGRALLATEGLTRGRLREALAEARTRLAGGASLGEALRGGHCVIPEVVLGMVRAGERGSRLAPALEQVAAHLEQEADLFARVRQALAYPALLAVVGVVSILVIGTVIVPRFAALLTDLGEQLPPTTRLLILCSTLFSHSLPFLVPALAAGVLGARQLVRRPAVRLRVDNALLTVPALGPVRRALGTARVARALGGMLRAGMPLLPALAAAEEAAGDSAIAARLRHVREQVARGLPLARSLEREHAVLPAALQLIAVGEASGRLGEMALRAGDLAAQEAERGLKTLVTLIEPSLIVTFGGLVAFVAAALLQAVYSLRP